MHWLLKIHQSWLEGERKVRRYVPLSPYDRSRMSEKRGRNRAMQTVAFYLHGNTVAVNYKDCPISEIKKEAAE